MMQRLHVLRAVAPIPVAIGVLIWRSGYAAPLLYGFRRWAAARPNLENDPIG